MNTPADDTRILSESKLAEIAGVPRPTRANWASQDLLRQAGRSGYGELDAIELVAFAQLVSLLDFDDAELAWKGVRHDLGAGALTGRPLLIVFDLQHKESALVNDPRDVGELVLSGRPFRVLDVGTAVAEMRAVFRRLAEQHAARAARRASKAAARRRSA